MAQVTDLDDIETKAQHDLTCGSSRRSKPARVILELIDRLRKAESALDEEFHRGRLAGRKGVAKYSKAIAEIEKALGTEAVPLRQTVLGVRRLRHDRDASQEEVTRLRDLLREATHFIRDAQDLLAEELDDDDWASGEDFLSRARAALGEPDGE